MEMKTTELISHLQSLVDEYGDCNVKIEIANNLNFIGELHDVFDLYNFPIDGEIEGTNVISVWRTDDKGGDTNEPTTPIVPINPSDLESTRVLQ